jgi:hypothetical protein
MSDRQATPIEIVMAKGIDLLDQVDDVLSGKTKWTYDHPC